MKYNISVEKAITRGRIIAVFIPLLFMIGTPSISVLAFKAGPVSIIGGIIAGIALSWIAWSIGITYWKIWALENVRNIHQLKKRAVEEKIIWRDGSFFEKTEIKTATQKERLMLLQERYNEEDVFNDDSSVPDATYIYFSKFNSYSELTAGLLILGSAVYFYISGDTTPKAKFLMYAGPIIGLVMMYQGIKKLRNTKPQLIIDEEGIKMPGQSLIAWQNINNTTVTTKNKTQVLQISHLGGFDEVEMQKLATNAQKVRYLIDIYRMRNEKNRKPFNNYQSII